jgi:uncharacterized protein YkwD
VPFCYSPAIFALLSALHRSKRRFCLAVAALTWLGAPTPASGANVNEQAIFDKMRTTSGQRRPFLVLDPLLEQVARAKAADLANRDYFDHTNPDGHGPNWLVEQAGYPLPAHYDHSPDGNNIESLAAGYASADDTWQSWMDSGGHRQHLLATHPFYAEQTHVGIGYVNRPGSRYTHYWVVLTAPPPGPNPYREAMGRYGAVFSVGENQALMRCALSATGGFSGRLRMPGAVLPFNGSFGESGRATRQFDGGYTLTLIFDGGLSGTLSGPGFSTSFTLELLASTGGARAGRYTLVLAGPEPAGSYGSAVVRVLSDGTAALIGNRPDGSAFTATAPITESGTLLLYVGQHAGLSQLAGPLYFRATSAGDLDGTLRWLNPALATGLEAIGARYIAPAPGQPPLPVAGAVNNVTLTLAPADLPAPVQQSATLTADPALLIPAPALPALAARVNGAAGRFTGSYAHPQTGALTKFRGVILQKQGAAFGLVLGSGGAASLAPAGSAATLARP